MSEWRKKMGVATFRGVPFYVDTKEHVGGHRLAKHEYPGRDIPYGEPLGLKARTFAVEGHVVGSDYLTQRDTLKTALEKQGPGELKHPAYFGTLRVIPETFRIRETAEGGIAYFSIEFFETPAQPAEPASVVDASAQVEASTTAALLAVNTEFLITYSPTRYLAGAAENIRQASLAINAAVSRINMSVQDLANFKSRVDEFASAAVSLANTPDDVVAQLADILGAVPSIASLLVAYSFNPGTRPSGTSPSRVQEQENYDAFQALVQRVAAVNAARLAPSATFDSYDAAVSARDSITALLDAQMETASDDTFAALETLRADLVRAVPGNGKDLGHIVRHTPPATVPSLVLAHSLYGDLDREADLIARNRIANPCFVVGGQALEIISDS